MQVCIFYWFVNLQAVSTFVFFRELNKKLHAQDSLSIRFSFFSQVLKKLLSNVKLSLIVLQILPKILQFHLESHAKAWRPLRSFITSGTLKIFFYRWINFFEQPADFILILWRNFWISDSVTLFIFISRSYELLIQLQATTISFHLELYFEKLTYSSYLSNKLAS